MCVDTMVLVGYRYSMMTTSESKTTIKIDVPTSKLLANLANTDRRSMTKEVYWLIERECQARLRRSDSEKQSVAEMKADVAPASN